MLLIDAAENVEQAIIIQGKGVPNRYYGIWDCHKAETFSHSSQCATQVVEKVSSASPVRLHTSSRLKKSFERVKAQVDVDLLHFRRDLVTLLGSTSDEEGLSVLQR